MKNSVSFPNEELIDLWADKFVELERYFKQRRIFYKRDRNFLTLLGNSVYRINVYNSALWGKLEKHKPSSGTKESLEKLIKYCKFHNDLVVSRIKHFFFKEWPNSNRNDLFLDVDRSIYDLGKKLWQVAEDPDSCVSSGAYFGQYFYLLGLLYAFIYDSYNDEGVFLHFQYNKDDFQIIRDIIMQELVEVKEENKFRESINRLMPRILSGYMARNGIPENLDGLTIRQVYAKFVYYFAENKILYVEPLTWHLFDIIGKIDGFMQDDVEFTNAKAKKQHDSSILTKVNEFVNRSLSLYEKMYSDGKMLYQEMFSLEADFITGIKSDYTSNLPDRKKIISTFINLDSYAKKNVSISLENLKPCASLSTSDMLTKIKKLDEKDLKIESLIECLSREELLSILQGYVNLSKKIALSDQTTLVGFYSSGVFLAHIFQIFKDAFNHAEIIDKTSNSSTVLQNFIAPVWMFKAFPYIGIHPLHTIQEAIECKNVLICDESFKTGFTYSIYEAYLRRALPRSPIFSVQTLFKHINSENVETFKTPIVASLFCVEKDNHIKITEDVRQVYDFDIKIKSDWSCLKKDFIKYTNMNGRIDLTCVISCTPLAWAVAQHFAEQIISECGTQPVFIFSPSPAGRVLELLTSFLLKLQNISVSFRKENINESFKVLIDLTHVTGFTALSHWELFQDIRKSDSGSLDSDFNLILNLNEWFK